MQRKALVIGIACAIGSLHAVGASAQEYDDDFDSRAEEFEITLEDVVDGPGGVEGVIMPLFEEQRDREVDEMRESRENDADVSREDESGELEDFDEGEADDYDDGDFDDYDDGEEIETGEDDEPAEDLGADEVVDEELGADEVVDEELGADAPG